MAIPGAAVRRFDAWAPYYDESQLRPAYDAAHRAVLHLVTRVGMRPRRVLDVGCGTARLPRAVADRFPDAAVIGLDPSGPMLSVASEDRRLGLLRGAAETLPFADDCFDLVVSTAAFRHWSDPAGAMTEIARVMAPDGLLAMADLFATERGGLIPIWSRRPGPPATLRAAVDAAGLVMIRAEVVAGFGPVPAVTAVAARAATRRRVRTWGVALRGR
jgi:ubiquinone/menaquinone biosynthesis C-methylase UbiE